MADKSNIVLIKEFFLPDVKSADAMPLLRALTDEDKTQLGEGIRNGTLTY